MKQKTSAKIFATIALVWIIIGIIGTGLLFLISGFNQAEVSNDLTEEELQQLLNEAGIDPNSASGSELENNEVIDLVWDEEDLEDELNQNTSETEVEVVPSNWSVEIPDINTDETVVENQEELQELQENVWDDTEVILD